MELTWVCVDLEILINAYDSRNIKFRLKII